MLLADFVDGVMNGSVEVVGGGRAADGYYTGVVDPSSLTDEDIAAEAISRDIVEVLEMRFADVVKRVREMRGAGNVAAEAANQQVTDEQPEQKGIRIGWIEEVFREVWKNCGTGAGGFQPGNTCGSGGGKPGSISTPVERAIARATDIHESFRDMTDKQFAKVAVSVLKDMGMDGKEATAFVKSLEKAAATTVRNSLKNAALGENYDGSWDEETIKESATGAIRGVIAGIALYVEVYGADLSERSGTIGTLDPKTPRISDSTESPMERLSFAAEAQNTQTGASFILAEVRKEDGVLGFQTRPQIRFNVAATVQQERRENLMGFGGKPIDRVIGEMAKDGLGSNFTVETALMAMGTAYRSGAALGKIADIAFSGDKEALGRMTSTVYGRAGLRAIHNMMHEFGHWQHWQRISAETRAALPNATPQEVWKEGMNRWRSYQGKRLGGLPLLGVSKYAASMDVEFVAEVFSGYALGLRFSKSVGEAYAALNGPRRATKSIFNVASRLFRPCH